MRFRAKYPSICPRCGKHITVGQEIDWQPHTRHVDNFLKNVTIIVTD